MSKVIEQYNIEFINRYLGEPLINHKLINTNKDELAVFINDLTSVDYLDEEIIPSVKSVLSGELQIDYLESTIYYVQVKADNSKFIEIRNDNATFLSPDLIMNTSDLKEIIHAWREFLLTPPLDGTPVSGSEDNLMFNLFR